jgi:hypothetical protein
MTVKVEEITGEVFSTQSRSAGDKVTVRLIGCLDLETAPTLQKILNQLARAVDAGDLAEIEFEIENLYLLSSSAISYFASWLKTVRASGRVRLVKFKMNPNLAWQRRSLDALRRLAEPLVSLE